MNDLSKTLARRIQEARLRLGWSQGKLAEALSFPTHQVMSAIEKGSREVKAWELAKLAKALCVPVSELLCTEEPAPRPVVVWRGVPTEARKTLEARFLQKCEEYALLEQLCDTHPPAKLPRYQGCLSTMTYADAEALAVQAAKILELGAHPAESLVGVLENDCGVKIWFEDLKKDGSAASTLSEQSFGLCGVHQNGRAE
ncbi:MAG: helix-turn-helix transcriptional regulator [Planctomycetota bacterium]|nr:helix-turn-helix transcriptional regulator [Planctomycetota bacterium]